LTVYEIVGVYHSLASELLPVRGPCLRRRYPILCGAFKL
jgi:hypothetical protein